MDRDEEFSAYAAARWAAMVRSAVVLGCSVDEAHDLAQTVLLKCYVSWHKVSSADSRDSYVYRILLNSFRDSRRRRWWGEQPAILVPDPPIADQTDHVDVSDAVQRALADLTPTSRQVVVLRYLAHLSERETAQILAIPVGTVKSRLARALAQLAHSPHFLDGSSA